MPTISDTQQVYIDMLYELQCCIATKTEKLNDLDVIGSDCYEENFLEIAEITIILEMLLCQDIDNLVCLDLDEIKQMISYVKRKCKNCCIDIKELQEG